jgi:hypothetical protein
MCFFKFYAKVKKKEEKLSLSETRNVRRALYHHHHHHRHHLPFAPLEIAEA